MGRSSPAVQSAAPEVARQNLDGAERRGSGTFASRGAPRSPLDCELAPPEQPFRVWPGQLSARKIVKLGPWGGRNFCQEQLSTSPKTRFSSSAGKCGLTTTYLPSFIHHQGSHSGDKPYHRAEYGKSFRRGCDLVKHQRVHTSEKPYPCPECGRRFSPTPVPSVGRLSASAPT
nr:zinc finger and SCAN domain-containing protein 2-like [Aotus nancymaae]